MGIPALIRRGGSRTAKWDTGPVSRGLFVSTDLLTQLRKKKPPRLNRMQHLFDDVVELGGSFKIREMATTLHDVKPAIGRARDDPSRCGYRVSQHAPSTGEVATVSALSLVTFPQSTTSVVDNIRRSSYIARMSKQRPPKPTEAELELLRILWEQGPSTVREIHVIVSGEKETGYTTTLKILQKMADKGLVARDASQRSHIYRAAVRADKTQRQLVHELLDRAFGGAADKLILHALSSRAVSRDEIDTLRKLLDELEEKS